MRLSLKIKYFSFPLVNKLKTFQGFIKSKTGWLLKIEIDSGNCGWGEVSPIHISEIEICEKILKQLGTSPCREELEKCILFAPGALGFGIGAALAELDSLIGTRQRNNWLQAPESALLLPTNESLLSQLDNFIDNSQKQNKSITLKWKVCIKPNHIEEQLLQSILKRLPTNSFLRIDANAGWNRQEANKWANYLLKDPRLEWLEQPLPANDIDGLFDLSEKVPVALDESLIKKPSLKNNWKSWQIRHPSIEGDPRILLKELMNGTSHIVISTAFETGIGRRWINHLSALQQQSPTPTAPGLAPGWCPESSLFSNNPTSVWESV